jgi:hypothetical protein
MSANLTEKMKSETALVSLDGFDGYTDEGLVPTQEDFAPSVRVIQGHKLAFMPKQGIWVNVDANKQPMPDNVLLLVHDILRVVQEWGTDGMPAGPPNILGPNEKWPDVEAMNEKCPKTKWRMYYDKLIGPFQRQKVVYLWDPTVTMNKYTFAASSDSAMACVSNLVEKIKMQRAFKKVKAYPIVGLGSLLWSKKYNTLGPDLVVYGWMKRDEDGALLSLPTTPAALAAPSPAAIQEALGRFAGMTKVEPPTAAEATNDSIPY